MATIGLRDVHFALLTSDPSSGDPVYAAPVKVVGAITATINPNTAASTLFYDDGPGDTAATMGEISLELNLADIPLDIQSIWLGHVYANGVLRRKGADTPPWLAIGFRTLKSSGAYRYIWLNKGKFTIPEENYQTKGDSIEFGTPTITGSFVKRDCDDEWQRVADEDMDDFDPSYAATWFASPTTISGVFASGKYDSTLVTVAGSTDLSGAKIVIEGDAGVAPGEEDAEWLTNTLTLTLSAAAVYTRAALQTLVNHATGTAPGDVIILTSGDLTASDSTVLTLTMEAV